MFYDHQIFDKNRIFLKVNEFKFSIWHVSLHLMALTNILNEPYNENNGVFILFHTHSFLV